MADAPTWLTLLVEDAPAERLEAYRVTSTTAADSEVDRERVDGEARRALHLRALLTERRQRTAELSALLDLTRRLSAFRDVEALLHEVVTQARRLLGVDVAYLALVQPDGALEIRFTDGSTGLRGAKLSPRTGIAGRVATTGEPFRTANYLAETAIEHEAAIDTLASSEGLSAIAGVPLRAGDQIIGVLFASDRAARDFTDADMSLLSSLGAHASIAVENARLFEELVAANDQLREQRDTTQRAVALHERLTGVVLGGGSTDDVLKALADVVPGSMELLAPGASVPKEAAGGHRTIVPVTAGEDRLGSLVADTAVAPSAADRRLLERSALTLALVLLSDRAVLESQTRTRSELVASLLTGAPSADVVARLRAAGVDVTQPQCIVVIDAPEEERAALDALHDVGLGSVHDGVAVVIAAGADPDALVEIVGKRLDRIGGTVAVHGPTNDATTIADAYVEARRGAQLLAALGRSGVVATVDQLGPFRYLFGRAGAGDANRFVAGTVGPLLDHDAAKNSDLTRTLELYLENAQQHAATAAAVGIHANTLYQRLARIAELLGDDWRARALDLHLAIRLHRLSDELRSSA